MLEKMRKEEEDKRQEKLEEWRNKLKIKDKEMDEKKKRLEKNKFLEEQGLHQDSEAATLDKPRLKF